MKNKYLIIAVMLLTAVAFGQKKEIKKADKALKAGNYSEALTLLNQAEGLLDNAEASQKIDFYLIRAASNLGNSGADFSKLEGVGKDLMKASEIDAGVMNRERYRETHYSLKQKMETTAISDFNTKKFESARDKFLVMYNISKKDTVYLANAAISAKNGKDYDAAIMHYEKLLNMGYTGIKEQLVATNKETGKVEAFDNATQRDLMIRAGSHIKPETQKSESSQEEMLRNLTQIYLEKGDNNKALELLKNLREKKPDDNLLLRTEADINYELGNIDKYNELISELVGKEPNNPELYFNLGVASAKSGDTEKAMDYYKKSLEIDPEYARANINIASLILDGQTPLVEEMNGLGTSRADYARYDALKLQLEDIQRKSLPYLEAAVRLRPDNIEFARSLMNIYTQLRQDDKAGAMKAKIQQLEGGQ